ncbi:HDOD domain-containing protein [Acidihalobacter ferrooxydans]|uniref:histidine kinase n=1 Tax=Acidihalobacter ferrooxydans TaxID=1765967 RepID=A0A1P8UED6_9GAMM|nr:HDOD domain-containing protein [Acidihalobacter ferrooxydans]APZ42215.1 hypothetical protein BW247_03160 [Acidihalobacter ferrooxydans]
MNSAQNSALTPQLKAVDITQLPTPPQVVFQLLDACEEADKNLTDIADLIRQDAALAARVLALSASPIYGHQRHSNHPASLERSLMLLGIDTVRTLALTAAVYQYINKSLATHSDLLRRFWRESLLTATLAERLATLSGYAARHEAYLAGLISNLGQIALLAHFPADYVPLFEQSGNTPDGLLRQEIATFGIDHAALGAMLLQRAGRTGPLVDAIRHHHASADALTNAHHLVRLIAVANRLTAAGQVADATSLVEADRLLGLIPGFLDETYDAALAQTEQTAQKFALADEVSSTTPAADAHVSPLAHRLSELHLIAAVRRQFSDADSIESLCAASQIACSLLFGVHAIGFVLIQDNGASAIAHSPLDTAGIWPEFVFKLPEEQSLVGAVLSTGETRQYYPWRRNISETPAPAIVDCELMSLLQRQGLLAIALTAGDTRVGAILIGLDPDEETRLTHRKTLLSLFAKELGSALTALRQRCEQQDSERKAQAAEFRLLTHSIAHEARNPLSIIQNYLAVLEKHAASASPEIHGDIRIIGEEITRVGAILRTLTDTVDENSQDEITRLNTLAEDVANLFKPTLFTPQQIGLELSLDPAIPDIVVSRNSVKQILVNLVKNAAEALRAGQTVYIRTEDYVYSGSNAYVSVEISDNGPGIPPQILATLFEPVVSTKGKSHSGLGLSITKRLVDSLHGQITCRSGTQGTRFQILLPRTLPDA